MQHPQNSAVLLPTLCRSTAALRRRTGRPSSPPASALVPPSPGLTWTCCTPRCARSRCRACRWLQAAPASRRRARAAPSSLRRYVHCCNAAAAKLFLFVHVYGAGQLQHPAHWLCVFARPLLQQCCRVFAICMQARSEHLCAHAARCANPLVVMSAHLSTRCVFTA